MIIQIVSVLGALMILIAYGMIQHGLWREIDPRYLAFNLVGSIVLGIVALLERQVGFMVLEFAWIVLAMLGVVRALRLRRERVSVS